MSEDASIDHTVAIVSAFVSSNRVAPDELLALIRDVHAAIADLGKEIILAPAAPAFEPAVPVKKSIFSDRLVSLIDGKSYKSLRRHLGVHGLTPDGYRERYGLPANYPMVCSDYSAKRSQLAKDIGLGKPVSGAKPQLAAVA